MLPLLLLLSRLASAQTPEERAEAQRIASELRDRVVAGRWEAADGSYQRLRALPAPLLSYEDHYNGYLAARALGDAIAQAERLEAARAIRPTEDTDFALATLMAWYGRAELRVHRRVQPTPALEIEVMPFEPDQRRVLETANASLQATGAYDGLLPLGMYRLGSARFEIVGEETPVQVLVKR